MNDKNYEYLRFQSISSTNDYAKEKRKDKKNLIITANEQTGGRGTKGRSFSSALGGVYLSKLDFYENFPAKESFQIMINSAVAVCETLAFFGLQPKIKWPNDIFIGEKKICGILIENTFSGRFIANSIVGIGINVCNTLEKELDRIATTIEREGKAFSADEVREKLVAELLKTHTIESYRAYLGFLGQEVLLDLGAQRIPATLLSVDDGGRLQASVNGEIKTFSSAEVSIRI